MKIVINKCYGGFALSKKCLDYVRKAKDLNELDDDDIKRTDSDLINAIETLGAKECGETYSRLVVVDIPKGSLYRIVDYDGLESIEYNNDVDWCLSE